MLIYHKGKTLSAVVGLMQQQLREVAAGEGSMYMPTGDSSFIKLTVKKQNRSDLQGEMYDPDVWVEFDTSELSDAERKQLTKLASGA